MLSQPDRPAGRGHKARRSPVAELADAHDVPVLQPPTLREPSAVKALAGFGPDVLVVAAYGLILPVDVLALPRLGCLNIHASLLPRWRGAAPIHRAIEAGDAATGVCIMQMEKGLDTGPVGHRIETPIEASDTTATLHDRLAELGCQAIIEVLQRLADPSATIDWQVQPDEGITYASKIDKAEAWCDWNRPAGAVAARIRAFDPMPGSCARLEGVADAPTLRFFDPEVPAVANRGKVAAGTTPGTIVAVGQAGVDVQCADGIVRLRQWQRPGGRRLAAAAFLGGCALQPGDRLSSGAPPQP